MRKLEIRIDKTKTSARIGRDTLREGRIATEAEIIRTHCLSIIAHLKDEKVSGPNALIHGGYTRYGEWWRGERDPKKRPFYIFGPERINDAVRKLTEAEVKELADELRLIATKSVKEYLPAAEAAKGRLMEIGLPV